MSINPYMKGDGLTNLEVTKISDLSDAFVQYSLPDGSEHSDSLVASAEIVKVPVLFKNFSVKMQDILTWENRTVSPGATNSLDSLTSLTASLKVAEQEEELLFNGWKPDGTTYAIKGMNQIAGNSVTGGSIATAGTMYGYIGEAIGKLMADKVKGEGDSYNLAITSTIYTKLITRIMTNGTPEIEYIKKLLGNGSIYVTDTLALQGGSSKEAAIVTPVDTSRVHFELLNPVDYKIVLANPEFEGLSPVKGVSYELISPYFKRLNSSSLCDAVCKITSLEV
jgi:uncharacterized linocin/CFP29 family protein